jgi:hypothetical protein
VAAPGAVVAVAAGAEASDVAEVPDVAEAPVDVAEAVFACEPTGVVLSCVAFDAPGAVAAIVAVNVPSVAAVVAVCVSCWPADAAVAALAGWPAIFAVASPVGFATADVVAAADAVAVESILACADAAVVDVLAAIAAAAIASGAVVLPDPGLPVEASVEPLMPAIATATGVGVAAGDPPCAEAAVAVEESPVAALSDDDLSVDFASLSFEVPDFGPERRIGSVPADPLAPLLLSEGRLPDASLVFD